MARLNTLVLITLIVALLALSMSVFTVSEVERAIRLRLGQIVDEQIQPGVHVKIPGFHVIRKFDARVMTLDAAPQSYFTAEKKRMVVDSFATWRIREDGAAKYYLSTGGSESTVKDRLANIINSELRKEFAQRTIEEVVSGEREKVMELLVKSANQKAEGIGVEVLDVRVKKIELPEAVNEAVFNRMRTAREKIARDIRAKGAAEAERTRAEADRQKTVILAEAYQESEILRGEGDGKSAEIYAKAYNKNPEFYSFYRRLLGYKNTLNKKEDVLVIKPEGEFFKFFNKK